MVSDHWSIVCLHGFALHSVYAATATLDSHFRTLLMLENTRQHSLLYCSSHCMLHIAVSLVVTVSLTANRLKIIDSARLFSQIIS